MGYRMMGRGHAALMLLRQRLAGQVGQGTVEYVALILLVAGVMAAVVAAGSKSGDNTKLATKITGQITSAIDKAVSGK